MFGEMLERLLTEGTLLPDHAAQKIAVIAEVRAAPGHEDRIRQLLKPLAESARAQPGCLAYHLLEDTQDPARFSTYQEWTGADALERHLNSDDAKRALDEAQPLIEGTLTLRILRLIA